MEKEERVSYIVNTIVDDWDSPKLYIEAYVSNLKTQLKKQKEINKKAIEYINTHKRKDEFLELNEWQTRELLQILEDKEV